MHHHIDDLVFQLVGAILHFLTKRRKRRKRSQLATGCVRAFSFLLMISFGQNWVFYLFFKFCCFGTRRGWMWKRFICMHNTNKHTRIAHMTDDLEVMHMPICQAGQNMEVVYRSIVSTIRKGVTISSSSHFIKKKKKHCKKWPTVHAT